MRKVTECAQGDERADGRKSAIGQSRSRRLRSTKHNRAIAVTGFVIERMSKIESSRI